MDPNPKVGDTWTKKQKWMMDNIITLLENQKTEIYLLTQRVTKLEINQIKNAMSKPNSDQTGR